MADKERTICFLQRFSYEIGRFNVSHDAYHVSRDTLLILASVIPSSNSIIIIIISC